MPSHFYRHVQHPVILHAVNIILLNLSIPTDLAVLYTLYCNGNNQCHWLYIGV